MIAQGATSPAGQFCSDARTALLGGYNDWYIPSRYEFYMLKEVNSNIPVAEQMSGVYLTSTEYDADQYRTYDVDNGAYSAPYKTTGNIVRLIRKIHASEFVPT
jgi:hypothetical protein